MHAPCLRAAEEACDAVSLARRLKNLAKGRAFEQKFREAEPGHLENIQQQQQQQQKEQQHQQTPSAGGALASEKRIVTGYKGGV